MLRKIDKLFSNIEITIIYIVGFLIIFLTLLNVLNRYIIKSDSMRWYQEVIIIFYTSIIFWGVSHLARTNSLMKVDFIIDKIKNKKAVRIYKFLTNLFCMVISILGVYYLYKYALLTKSATPVLGIPSRFSFLFAYIFPFIGLSFRYLFHIVKILDTKE